jgi:hypothetical protein
MAGGEKGGLRGRMGGYFREGDGICGPVDTLNQSVGSNRFEFITNQMRQAFNRQCDVQVSYRSLQIPVLCGCNLVVKSEAAELQSRAITLTCI